MLPRRSSYRPRSKIQVEQNKEEEFFCRRRGLSVRLRDTGYGIRVTAVEVNKINLEFGQGEIVEKVEGRRGGFDYGECLCGGGEDQELMMRLIRGRRIC